MTFASCPTAVVDAPAEAVWGLLMQPARWADFFDLRIVRVEPPGPALVGQEIFAESGPHFLHLRLKIAYVAIDAANKKLILDVRLPFGIAVRSELDVVSLGSAQCRVNYNCNFDFPGGWRGALLRLLMRRELVAGPADSLCRLKRAAERLHAGV